ncbi:Uncharacterised protein [Segatella copri]|nr:Uncharacterised protein [Segatella copri]
MVILLLTRRNTNQNHTFYFLAIFLFQVLGSHLSYFLISRITRIFESPYQLPCSLGILTYVLNASRKVFHKETNLLIQLTLNVFVYYFCHNHYVLLVQLKKLYFGFPEPSSLLQLFVSFDPIFFLSYLGVSFASCSLFTCRKDGSLEESERQGIW